MQPSEEIKSKIDVVDLLKDYIQVIQAGANFKARCPFHKEKTPSFMISPEKQIWHCFGCGKGGDIFAFVQEIEGISFVEALRLLASKAGVTLKKQDPRITSKRNKILDIVEFSRKYYYQVLIKSGQASGAREYLKKRGLTDETIDEWQIGYSPDTWDSLSKLLKDRNYKDDEIFQAGMTAKNNTSSRFYDRFRGRIMFPINDINNNTVAFTARVSPEKEATEKMGKYINSPQTLVYDKSNILFGLNLAKMEIKAKDLAIIVEGQMDVITAHQNGFRNVIASSGTALTNEQIKLVKRFTNNIAISFDMDDAGQLAADRGIREAMKEEVNIKVIELESGKDPDECIKNDPSSWVRAVEDAKPMMQYYFDKVLKDLDLSKIENKRLVAKKLLGIIIGLENSIEKDHWMKELGQKIGVEEYLLREAMEKTKKVVPRNYSDNKKEPQAFKKINLSREEKLSHILFSIIIKYPVFIEYTQNHILTDHIFGDDIKGLYNNLLIHYNSINSRNISTDNAQPQINYQLFRDWLINSKKTSIIDDNTKNLENINNNQLKLLERLVLLADEEYEDSEITDIKKDLIKIIIELKQKFLKIKMKDIESKISNIENSDNKNEGEVGNLLEEFKLLSEEYREINL